MGMNSWVFNIHGHSDKCRFSEQDRDLTIAATITENSIFNMTVKQKNLHF